MGNKKKSTKFRLQQLGNGLSDSLENRCAKSSHSPLLGHQISRKYEILPSEVGPVFGSGLGSVIGPVSVRRYVRPDLPVRSGPASGRTREGEVRWSGRTSFLGVRSFPTHNVISSSLGAEFKPFHRLVINNSYLVDSRCGTLASVAVVQHMAVTAAVLGRSLTGNS